jgi:hypothetical protein
MPRRVSVDMEKFEKMCRIPIRALSNGDIANIMGRSLKVLNKRLKEDYGDDMTMEKFREIQQSHMRYFIITAQMLLIQDRNIHPSIRADFLKWWGINYLGQSQKIEAEISEEIIVSYKNDDNLKNDDNIVEIEDVSNKQIAGDSGENVQ